MMLRILALACLIYTANAGGGGSYAVSFWIDSLY